MSEGGGKVRLGIGKGGKRRRGRRSPDLLERPELWHMSAAAAEPEQNRWQEPRAALENMPEYRSDASTADIPRREVP